MAALAFTGLLASAPLSARQVPWPAGIYSDVRMSAETGDLGGLEVRFYEQGGRHMVEYVLCEGWCNQTTIAELRRDGDDFIFGGVIQVFTDGQQVPEAQHLRLRPKGKKFATAVGAGDDLRAAGMLKQATEPFGLAVAPSENEAAAKIPD